MLTRIITQLSKNTVFAPKYCYSEQPKASNNQEEKTHSSLQEKSWKSRHDQQQEQQDVFKKENRNTVGWWIYRFFFWGSFSILSYNIYLVYNHKKSTPVNQQIGAVPVFIDVAKGIVKNMHQMIEFITQPTSKKLLFDPVHPDLHPKTLILNLTGTIIQSQYVFGKGIKTTLRPGLQNLLKRLAQRYQIVIFAEEDEFSVMSKLTKIDPKQMYIRGVLGREAMVWKNGEFIKDLKYLNRDLRKVIVVDRKLENVKNHPQNTIILSEFQGDQKDIQLNKLTLLLQRLENVPDVRRYLASLGKDPVQTYYNRAKQFQQKVNKKASMFGVFNKDGKKENS